MALTKISTGGVKDDAASQAKIADEAVDEARLQVSNAGTNGQFLSKQTGNTGGLTWATVTVPDADKIEEGNTSVETVDTGSDGHVKITTEGSERVRLTNDGKIGIGLTDPQRAIHISSANTVIALTDTAASTDEKTKYILSDAGILGIGKLNDAYDTAAEHLRIGNAGQLGIAGANYGSSGQVLTSGGASAAPSWTTIAGGVSSDSQQNTLGGTNAGDSFTGTDANDNTLFGYNAGTAITSGDQNVFIGSGAGESLATTGECTIIGYQAGTDLTTAWTGCTVIGQKAGYKLTGTGGDVMIGRSAGYNQTSGGTNHANTYVGVYAGYSTTTGNRNVYIGRAAGYEGSTAYFNTCLGWDAGYHLSTGYNNLLLGKNSGHAFSPSGVVNSGNGVLCLGDNNINYFYCADTSISSSDSRDKTDVTNFTHGLSWVNKLNPVVYRWDKRTWYNEYNEDGSLKTEVTPDGTKKRARQHIGFLAQDVLAVEQADGYASKKDDMLVVNLNEDDTAYGLKYERLIPVLVNAIKELSAKVETLETKVAALESA